MNNQTFSIWDGSIASSSGGGTGTESNPYLINSAAQLAYLAEVFNDPNVQKNKNTYYSKYYKLTSNIDLDKREWTPIGCVGIPDYKNCAIFFDGNNHIVRGLFIDRPEDNYIGLFGHMKNLSVIRNLVIEDGFILGKEYVGGIVGKFTDDSNSIIENCSFSGQVQGYNFVSGIVGAGRGKLLKDCTNSGTITCTGLYAGGIAARFFGSDDEGEVISCLNTGTISTVHRCGGIVGTNTSIKRPLFKYCRNNGDIINGSGISGDFASFEYCSNTGNISGGAGIIEWISAGYMKNCYNSGTITRDGGSVGGLTGYATSATIESCTNTGTVNGTDWGTGGICGKSNYSTIEYCTNVGVVNCSGKGRVGGIVGEGYHVIQCHNTGSVKGDSYVAGICGYSESEDFLIAGCVNDGFIEARWRGAGIAGYCKGTIQNCINMAPIQSNSGAGGIVCVGGIAVKNCYNTGSLTGSNNLGGIIGTTLVEGFILEKNYNSGEIGSTVNSGGILGELDHDRGQIIDCYYHAGSAQKGIGINWHRISIEATGYVDSVVSADNPKTVPALLTQSIMTNTLAATLLFWSKKKQQLLTQISKLMSISKSLGVGQDENEEPLNEIAGDDMYIITEHTPVREAADPNSNIIAMSFKKDIVKVLPQTRSVQGDYYRILTEAGQVGLLPSTSLVPAEFRGAGNTPYTVTATEVSISKYPGSQCNDFVGHLNYGAKVWSVPDKYNKEYIVKLDGEVWIEVYMGVPSIEIGWVRRTSLREGSGQPAITNDWLKLYSSPTVSGTGRPVAKHPNANNYDWGMPEELKGLISDNLLPVNARNVTGKTPIKASNNGYMDAEGRYWVAVGPNVMNPNYKDTSVVKDSDMQYGTKIDIHVVGQLWDGKLWQVKAAS